MKFLKIKNSTLAATLMLLLYSCADPELGPLLTLDNVKLGAYIRGVSVTSSEFDLNDLANSSYQYGVEFVSEQDGKDVASYEIWVSKYDIATKTYSKKVLHKTFTKTDFQVNANGFPAIDVSLSVPDVSSTLNVTDYTTEYEAGDYIRFDGIIVTDDGMRFGYDNSSSPVRGSALEDILEEM
ncbi:MAG: hypothetical protein HUJ11_02170 [Arenibacter algicola]|nr:hypothetical protein [Arenibacter algicola]